eukprot:CAMPEP_0206247516 /NCGR_PEP_ID=MMETSP0047_2-20121206/19850_1 /ASSEMBLY_ACC=CAM_ASM_000192 /TAXON_ID=195065 /ORGANISM="Chroomonas mesostigmatica_cf, Strain CCMP1168" /LENGTH=73 /DNA_ID=CAMNT_0053673043 /DNA_START=51 /DNA_END=268 /DNA_ORIENTATION=-
MAHATRIRAFLERQWTECNDSSVRAHIGAKAWTKSCGFGATMTLRHHPIDCTRLWSVSWDPNPCTAPPREHPA